MPCLACLMHVDYDRPFLCLQVAPPILVPLPLLVCGHPGPVHPTDFPSGIVPCISLLVVEGVYPEGVLAEVEKPSAVLCLGYGC